MKTDYTIYRTDGTQETKSVDWPEDPGFERINAIVSPVIGVDNACFEHVSVLYNSHPSDMFVDDTGLLKNLPRNDAATDIYRAATMRRTPRCNPETLPHIAGTAIVFDRKVWF